MPYVVVTNKAPFNFMIDDTVLRPNQGAGFSVSDKTLIQVKHLHDNGVVHLESIDGEAYKVVVTRTIQEVEAVSITVEEAVKETEPVAEVEPIVEEVKHVTEEPKKSRKKGG